MAVLAIVVAAGEAHSAATTVLLATAKESLAAETSLRVVEVANPTAAEALRVEREVGAGVTATVVWKDPARLHVLLRFHLASTNRWTTREITFAASDTLAERGRTLGFAVASIWPEAAAFVRPEIPVEDAPPPPSEPTSAASAAEVRPRLGPEPQAPSPSHAPAPAVARPREGPPALQDRPPRTPPRAPPERLRIGLVALAASGVGGPASGFGAGASVALSLSRDALVRVAGSFRRGSVSELPGSNLAASLAAGFEWWPLPTSDARSWTLGIRGDLLGLWQQVRAAEGMGPADTQSRLLPGADLLGQAAIRLAPRFEMLASFGVEEAFGATDIRKGSQRLSVATIPATRLVAEVGLRVGL